MATVSTKGLGLLSRLRHEQTKCKMCANRPLLCTLSVMQSDDSPKKFCSCPSASAACLSASFSGTGVWRNIWAEWVICMSLHTSERVKQSQAHAKHEDQTASVHGHGIMSFLYTRSDALWSGTHHRGLVHCRLLYVCEHCSKDVPLYVCEK